MKFIKDNTLNIFISICLLLPHGAHADTHSDQEIGEPYYDRKSSVGTVDSAALAPTGERLYTLKDGVLYQYGISPLKKINSIKVDFDSRQPKDNPYRIFITNDEKRVIIYSKKDLRLLNLKNGKVIKTMPFMSVQGVLNDDEFLMLDNNNKGTVIDASNLIKKHEFTVSGYEAWAHGNYGDIGVGNLIKAGDHLVLHRRQQTKLPGGLTIFDADEYKIIWKIYHHDNTRSAISYDYKALYVQTPLKELKYLDAKYNHREKYKKEHGSEVWDGQFPEVLQVDLTTGEWGYLTKNDFKNRFRLYIPLSKAGLAQQISQTQQYYILNAGGRIGLFYRQEKPKPMKVFLQFKDGEAVFISKTNYFQVTANARKYLKMKNSKGKIVPINDITFEKYNKANIDH